METEIEHRLEQIRATLREKETLLKEIHHRVKNNLQVISSLLSLQSDNLADADARRLFLDARDRVRSMALVHEKFYESHNLARIELGEYLHSLMKDLFARPRGLGVDGAFSHRTAAGVSASRCGDSLRDDSQRIGHQCAQTRLSQARRRRDRDRFCGALVTSRFVS